MKCPACGNELQQVDVKDIVVDVCDGGCGGIWFDNYELQKMDERHESAGECLLDVARDADVRVDYAAKRPCPKCDGITMLKHFVSAKMEIEVDECPACGGFWLDYGELNQIRDQYTTDEERREATKEYFAEVFSGDLAKLREESQEKVAKARAVAKMFRFICPSYYIPGKQDWGAF